MRIVSLACSNTEIVAALGCADRLVGVDDHSDFPPEALEGLARVGPDLEIDMEKVAALEPDLVLASLTVPGHETVVEALEASGLPHVTMAPTTLEHVYENVATIADRLGVSERGRVVAQAMRAELGSDLPDGRGGERAEPAPGAGGAADSPGGGPSILIQWWPKPVISPCAESWVDPLLRRAGGRNPLGHEQRPSRPLTDAEVAALDPDALVISWCGVDPARYRPDVVYRNPAFVEVSAIRNRRVFCVPEAYLGRPGPRLVEGVRALRRIVTELEGE